MRRREPSCERRRRPCSNLGPAPTWVANASRRAPVTAKTPGRCLWCGLARRKRWLKAGSKSLEFEKSSEVSTCPTRIIDWDSELGLPSFSRGGIGVRPSAREELAATSNYRAALIHSARTLPSSSETAVIGGIAP